MRPRSLMAKTPAGQAGRWGFESLRGRHAGGWSSGMMSVSKTEDGGSIPSLPARKARSSTAEHTTDNRAMVVRVRPCLPMTGSSMAERRAVNAMVGGSSPPPSAMYNIDRCRVRVASARESSETGCTAPYIVGRVRQAGQVWVRRSTCGKRKALRSVEEMLPAVRTLCPGRVEKPRPRGVAQQQSDVKGVARTLVQVQPPHPIFKGRCSSDRRWSALTPMGCLGRGRQAQRPMWSGHTGLETVTAPGCTQSSNPPGVPSRPEGLILGTNKGGDGACAQLSGFNSRRPHTQRGVNCLARRTKTVGRVGTPLLSSRAWCGGPMILGDPRGTAPTRTAARRAWRESLCDGRPVAGTRTLRRRSPLSWARRIAAIPAVCKTAACWLRRFESCHAHHIRMGDKAPVAQWNRAFGYEPEGRRFKSCSGLHSKSPVAQSGEQAFCKRQVAGSIPCRGNRGAVAHQGERLVCTQEAVGSIPSSSTNRIFTEAARNLFRFAFNTLCGPRLIVGKQAL